MLTKILFTALVILAVYMFYRYRGRRPVQIEKAEKPAKVGTTGHFAVYGFIVILLLVSGGVYYLHCSKHTK